MCFLSRCMSITMNDRLFCALLGLPAVIFLIYNTVVLIDKMYDDVPLPFTECIWHDL